MENLIKHLPTGAKTSCSIRLISSVSYLTIFICAIFISVISVSNLNAQNLDVPFVPTSENVVEIMLDLVDAGPGDYVIDLGSGDGRIVIAAAKRGAVGHGIDLDPRRIKEARENAADAGVEDKVLFIQEDLFTTDFSRASVVTMYLLNSVNLKLRPHLLKNLRPGTRIVSHDFSMDEWEPDEFRKEGYSDIYYWVIPADAKGNWRFKTGGEGFTLSVKQDFQKIDVNLRSGSTTYKISDAVLAGERISFTANHPNKINQLVFSGRIDGESITGTVQSRRGGEGTIEQWDASRN